MRHRCAPIILAAALLPACTSMRAVESPTSFLEQNNPKHVRVYANDGELYVLRDPQLRGDTIRGFEPLEQEELSLSVNGIRRMEAMQPDKKRTTIFIGAMTVLGGAGIYMITKAANGQSLVCDNYDVANRCVPRPTQAKAARIIIPLRF
ncbi:MAG TPA: hypothetical protein VGD27_14715 [Longimicrobiales bacterium]